MKVLIIGSGGREHALAWKINNSPKVSKIYVAPGNGGTATLATNIAIKETDIKGLTKFVKKEGIDLTVVGPEVPLNLGIVDEFEKKGLKIFGPKKAAARIEGSKAWAKDLFQKYNIPSGKSKNFSNPNKAKEYLDKVSFPIVLKADGLAAGKGVLICKTKEEALSGLEKIMLSKEFGEAGNEMIVEEFLMGSEVSVLAFTDGKNIKPMVPACDYKRVNDNDEGLNTGGMGVYSPPSFYTKELEQKVLESILIPTLKAFEKEGIEYKGILYAGIILTDEGPKILEYNCRFGDPETQVILPRLKTDIIDIFEAIINSKLEGVKIEWDKRACLGVVLASGGYPEKYGTGFEISGLDDAKKDGYIFHAGTKIEKDKVLTAGGRVLCISDLGNDIEEARDKVYSKIKGVSFEKMHYRKDIGLREIKNI